MYKNIIKIIIFIILYNIISSIILNFISYDDGIIHVQDKFNEDEIKEMQQCTDNSTNINTICYYKIQKKIINIIKDVSGTNYLNITHARFSNNSNIDAASYHKDIKIKFDMKKKRLPDVYTCICYLDKTAFMIGNRRINVLPGDIVIFKSWYLHKGLNLKIKNKNRRVIQFFHCFFDEDEKKYFDENHAYCNNNFSFNLQYIYFILDPRWFLEYLNLTRIGNFSTKNCEGARNKSFVTIVRDDQYIGTIDGIKYYKNL